MNPEIGTEGIQNRLLTLCRNQLARARHDAGRHFDILTQHGLAIVDQLEQVSLSSDVSSAGQSLDLSDDAARLKELAAALIMEFQFFDEFSQRMEHIESTINGCQNEAFQSEDVSTLDGLARIFSTRSEQDEFYSIFPEMAKYEKTCEASTISSIELF